MSFSGSNYLEEQKSSFARGVGAGAAAAVVGAAAWALVGLLTGYQIGFIAIGIGYLVGAAMARFGRIKGTAPMLTAALIALVGALVGHLAWVYTAGSRETGIAITTLIDTIGPVEVITNTDITEPFSWAFFALAAFTAGQVAVRFADTLPAPVGPAASYPPPVYPMAPPPVEPDADPAPPRV